MREAWISAALAAALALTAAPLAAQQRARPTSALVVACSGTLAKDSNHLKLATAFDSKNVTFTDVEASDGSKVPASVLFGNGPKRRLKVWWSNPAGRSDIHPVDRNVAATLPAQPVASFNASTAIATPRYSLPAVQPRSCQ